MPRLARNSLKGKTLFHIMVQGINKEKIFLTEREKLEYIKLLNKYIEENNIEIIAYCVMSNHVHILINTKNIDEITKYMHKVNTSYGIYYNKNRKRVGYVYRDRFKAQVINNENHLYNCILYIHNNPVKANICTSASQYKFSSYQKFLNKSNQDLMIEIFGSKNEYIKANEIENLVDMDFIEDESDNNTNIINTIKDYFIRNKTDYIGIKVKNNLLEEITLELKNKYNLSNVKISKYLQVSKYKIEKIINNKK